MSNEQPHLLVFQKAEALLLLISFMQNILEGAEELLSLKFQAIKELKFECTLNNYAGMETIGTRL